MGVQRSQASIHRGQKAAYVVTVSAENGSASDVSVALTTQPASQKPAFTSGCAKGNATAACALGTVSDKEPVDLQAQIPVASSASSVSSVTLTATASVVTTVKWTAPSAAVTVAVNSAPAASSSASPSPAKSSASPSSEAALPLGPIPDLNGVSSSLIGASTSLIGAGNVSGLFPAISPSATPSPSPSPGVQDPAGQKNVSPVADSATLTPVFTSQVAGLIALGVAIFLTVTRLVVRRRFRSGKPSS